MRELPPGKVHTYELSLVAGEFAHLIVEEAEWAGLFSVSVGVFAPDGTRVQEAAGSRQPRFAIWLQATIQAH